MIKKVYLVLFAMALSASTLAQSLVMSKLRQPPPNKLGIADIWNLELNNTTRKDIKGYITGSITEDKDGTILEGQSKPFVIKSGRNTYTYKDFSNADITYSNNKYKEILLRTGSAPEGDYTICIEIFSEEGELIGIENCIYHFVKQLGNISLLTPADGDEINSDQPAIFSWTPLLDTKEYSLKIVELIGNQSPESALQQNPPFFGKENIRATQFQYPITERKFQSDKSYAWVITSNGVVSDIGSFKVKLSTDISSTELPTKYRFTLMYPDGKITESSVNNFQIELEEFAKIIVADEGLNAPKKVTTPKQTQEATFGERVNAELINFFAQGENAEIGEEILILTGTPTGKTVPCPPQGCGCTDNGGESCSCKHWPGNDNYCLCQLCAIRGGGMEPIDYLPPPNNYNGTTIKDILIILKKDTSQVDESFKEIVKSGLNKVAELRRNKIEALVVKQSYESKKLNKLYMEYETEKFVSLNFDDFSDESNEKLSGIICMCDKEKGIGILCNSKNCDDCCKRVLIPATAVAFDNLSSDEKIKVCQAIAELGLNLKNCNGDEDRSILANLIEQANETFRTTIASIFNKVSVQNNLKTITDKFVFVTPHTLYTSPVLSFEGVENLTEQELSSGKDVMMTFFNVPQGSEIASGLFLVKAYKDAASTQWKAQFRTLNDKIILDSKAEFGSGNSKQNLNGRVIFYSEEGIKVRFGYHTKGYSFYTELKLKNGSVDKTRANDDEQAILSAIGIYRNEVESVLRKSTANKSIDQQILLATRDDAFFAFSIFEKINQNSDGSHDVFYTYLNVPGINPDFYKISIKPSGSTWIAYLLNSKNEIVKELSVRIKTHAFENIGLSGGIINNEVHMQLINNGLIDGIGQADITIRF